MISAGKQYAAVVKSTGKSKKDRKSRREALKAYNDAAKAEKKEAKD